MTLGKLCNLDFLLCEMGSLPPWAAAKMKCEDVCRAFGSAVPVVILLWCTFTSGQ